MCPCSSLEMHLNMIFYPSSCIFVDKLSIYKTDTEIDYVTPKFILFFGAIVQTKMT